MKFIGDWWRAMGMWRWLNILPIAIALYLAIGYEAMADGWINQGRRNLGGNQVRLYTDGAIRAGKPLRMRLVLTEAESLLLDFEGDEHAPFRVEADRATTEIETEIHVPHTVNRDAIFTVSNHQDDARWNLGRLIL